MIFLLGIYLFVGGVSALTNFGRWPFSSWIFGIVFLPFAITYYLIYGDAVSRKEAIDWLKLIGVLGLLYLFVLGCYFAIHTL